jgi:hypothetical protein
MADLDDTTKPKRTKTDTQDICRTALERYHRWIEREQDNINKAYSDLEFCWSDNQWSQRDVVERENDHRPILTINNLPTFVRQVTGDMRQMRPSIKVVPVDSAGDKKTAETIAGMVRYIENRSDAQAVYTAGADSQVSCGIGAWRVTTEYAADTTFNQEVRITGVDDAVAIAWDPDSTLITREDAKWCIVPVDMSREAFKEEYPDAAVEDFETLPHGGDGLINYTEGWYSGEMVRVAEYWVKKPMKRTLALMENGGTIDLTSKGPEEVAKITAEAKKIEQRPSYKVSRYLITAAHVLEEADWPGMHIPIIPVIGEEIRIGRRIVRNGLVRRAKDPQRLFNYFCAAQAESIANQPKAPYMATRKQIEQNQDMWATANRKNWPVLIYDADPLAPPPNRVQPALSSQGITEGIELAAENIKRVIGIYDASLGAKSNETSGKAILARQHEGDTGTFVYNDHWSVAIRRTGTIVIDLFPHIYDTERMIRIMGDDGKVDLKWINKPQGMQEINPETGALETIETVENDITVGAYDVVLETGPSYSTKRQEAKDGMVEFIRSAPETAPAVMDLVAKAQDWPLADQFAERLEAIAPPSVQKLIANQKKEHGDDEQPVPPTQQEVMAQQLQQRMAEAEVSDKEADVQKKRAETAKIAQEVQSGPGGPDPAVIMKAQGEQQKLQIDADRANLEHEAMRREMDFKERIAAVELEIKLTELAIKKAGLQIDTASAVLDVGRQQQDMANQAETHAANLVQGFEKHDAGLTQGMESHEAKIKQMSQPKTNGRQ